MKVKVITRHAPANYGSLLQTMATQKIIKTLGLECEIIDYIPLPETGMRIAFTQLNEKGNWNKNFFKKVIYIMGREPENLLMYHKFKIMRKKYLVMTERCKNLAQLQSLSSNEEEIFMTGSDQVWGPTSSGIYNPAYFLDFVSERNRKIAFAASFGKTIFTKEVLAEYTKYLEKYDRITVREDSAVDLISTIGLHAEQVLDPTLILSADEWSQYIKESVNGDYVLVYQIHNNPALDHYAVEFAKKANLPLIRVSAMLHQCKRGGKFVYLPNISKFLSLIKNARYLVTDSFHGTAFAINFNTQFVEILPNSGTESRNQSILRLTGLENRIVNNFEDFHYIEEKIDFAHINKILTVQRKKSVNILRNILIDNT